MPRERIVAVGLLTETDLGRLGDVLSRLWPVEEAPCFRELLQAIDAADAKLECADEPRLIIVKSE